MDYDDRSLADERSALSWERTALALATIAGLCFSAAERVPWIGIPAGAMHLTVAAAVAVRGHALARRRAAHRLPLAPEWAAARALTIATLASVTIAAALVVGHT
jgi:hypothetical protein